MKHTIKMLALGTLGLLTACAHMGTGQPGNTVLAELDDITTGSLQNQPAVLMRNGQPTVLYATKNGRVALQQGADRKLIDETARVQRGGSYFQLKQPQGNTLQALWWSHESGKNGYFTTSDDGGASFSRVSMVNSDHQILQPITWVQGQGNNLGIAYHDERLPNYQVFFNRSTDGGKTWGAQDQRMDTPPLAGRSSFVSEPQMINAAGAWVVAWVDTIAAADGAFRVIMRRSVDDGVSWTEPKTIYAGAKHISALTVRAQGKYVAIVADELERGIFAVTSSDSGEHWTQVPALAGTEHASNSGIAADFGPDRLHITWMQERKEQKTRIYAAALDMTRSNWVTAAQRLDTKDPENTRSQTPTIIATKAGPVVAAWVDFRDIRTNIYLAYSFDHGGSWTAPQPLHRPGEQAHGWPQLLSNGDAAALAYELYPTDRVAEGRFIVQNIALPSAEQLQSAAAAVPRVSDTQRRARLEQRIKSLWAARIEADYATAYDYFDFAFKAVTPKAHYLNSVGVITYINASLDTVIISGNEAKVNMKLRYEVKPTVIPGAPKPIEVPPVDVDSPNTWVWVKDDWYLVYHPTFDPPMLKY